MTSLIKVPFASSGDKTAVPETDATGAVNMTQGYGQAYSLDPATDPSAKRIERDKMNWLFNIITQAINEIQVSGVTPFITSADNGGSPFSYGKGALVSLGGSVYQSLTASNTTTPPGANWSLLPEKIQPLDATLTALASLTGSADKLAYFNGTDTAALTALTAFAREILAQTDAAGVLLKLGVSQHGQLLNVQTFSTSGTYTKTPGTNFVIVKQIGGGGASGAISATSSSQNSITCPGANGVYAEAKFTSGFDGVSVTVGAGGQPRLGNGFDGGQTSFGALLVCQGGTGSVVGNPSTPPSYTSPQTGTSAPTIDPAGTLLASDYGSYLQPALMAGLGVATNYVSWKITPFDRKGMGGNGRLNGASGVQQQGVAGNDGFCQVWEYS